MKTRIVARITTTLFRALCCLVSFGFLSTSAFGQAAEPQFDGPSVLPTDLTAGLELFYFDYKEVIDPPGKSSEYGFIPGLVLATTTNRHYPFYLRAGMHYAEATETYDGSTQRGDPRSSDTKSAFLQLGISGNYRIDLGATWTLTPHAGLTYRLWNRDIKGSGGIEEMYTWHTIPVGALLEYQTGGKFSIGLDLEAMIMVQGRIKIYFSSGSAYAPDAVLTLGNELGFRAEAPVRFALGNAWTLSCCPYIEKYGFKKSNPYRENGQDIFLEPSSTTYNYGLRVLATFKL
jgi:hypothetical protein